MRGQLMTDAAVARVTVRTASDEAIAGPLWDWPPAVRKLVETERRRRGMAALLSDDVGDSDYS